MIDKRVIAVIVIFILGGLFIYSFANPLSDGEENLGGNGDLVTPVDKDDDQESTKIDMSALDEIKVQFTGLNQADYTEESWELIQNLIRGAEESTSQEEFDLILSQIDLGTLAQKPVEVETPVQTTYPSGGGSSSVVKPSGSSNNTTKPSGNSSNTTTTNPVTINKTALNNIKTQLAKLNQNDYTTESWNIVQAQVKVADLQTTQAGFDAAVAQINLGLLQKKPASVNKTALNNVKTQASSLNPAEYTADSYKKLTEASNMPENTQDEINAKKAAIEAAMNGLQKKPVDKTALNNIKNQLAKYNQYDYTDASWNAIQNQIAVAEKQTSQDAFDKEVAKINLNTLQIKSIDKTKLNNIKDQLSKLKESNYTVTSWNEIQDQIVVAEKQATQTAFDREVAKIDLNTLQLRSTATKFGVSADKMGNSVKINVVKVNDNYVIYKGSMHTNTLTTEDGYTVKNFIVIKITSPDALSQTEKDNISLVYDGIGTIPASEFKTDINNHSYIEIYQEFAPANDGSGSDNNLDTYGFTVYWGYGEPMRYTITIDVTVD